MKRIIALLVMLAFVATVAGAVFARTLEEEKQAVRDYLKVIDAKIIKNRKMGKTAVVAKLKNEKAATLARWNKLKAEMESAQATPAPAPSQVTPPPAPVKAAPSAPSAGLFGLGLDTAVEAGLVAGMMGVSGNISFADMLGIGPMLGLSDKAVSYKLGLGYAQGKDINSKEWKAVPITVDGVINLPADWMGGVETFVGGGVNYVAYRTGQTSGSIGGQVYLGAQGDLGLGGMTYGELGYSILRTGTSDKGAYSSKSVTVLVGQKITL